MTVTFETKHIRNPLKAKSDDWQETADQWLCVINGVSFDYYTGIGHRVKSGFRTESGYTFEEMKRKNLSEEGIKSFCKISKPVSPRLDDLLHCLTSDAQASEQSFEDWCGDFGYDTDSIKALDTYRECQKIAGKLRKAKINIPAERERLANY